MTDDKNKHQLNQCPSSESFECYHIVSFILRVNVLGLLARNLRKLRPEMIGLRELSILLCIVIQRAGFCLNFLNIGANAISEFWYHYQNNICSVPYLEEYKAVFLKKK